MKPVLVQWSTVLPPHAGPGAAYRPSPTAGSAGKNFPSEGRDTCKETPASCQQATLGMSSVQPRCLREYPCSSFEMGWSSGAGNRCQGRTEWAGRTSITAHLRGASCSLPAALPSCNLPGESHQPAQVPSALTCSWWLCSSYGARGAGLVEPDGVVPTAVGRHINCLSNQRGILRAPQTGAGAGRSRSPQTMGCSYFWE